MSDENTITFVNFDFENIAPVEMLKVAPDGFYVRGVKLEQDENEARLVYNAFKYWLTIGMLTQ